MTCGYVSKASVAMPFPLGVSWTNVSDVLLRAGKLKPAAPRGASCPLGAKGSSHREFGSTSTSLVSRTTGPGFQARATYSSHESSGAPRRGGRISQRRVTRGPSGAKGVGVRSPQALLGEGSRAQTDPLPRCYRQAAPFSFQTRPSRGGRGRDGGARGQPAGPPGRRG